ncbi:MAG: dTDP-4-dehydrorhamnose reductase [Actinomycetota bacterium]|nr:dTDP-4-dehydrorhamnose reductase [Actinomycetota bacterium]
MRLLVTGAAGMLGRDVVDVARGAGHEVAGLSRAELDVVDAAAVERAVADLRPDAVVNCAAFTDVDGAEEHYDEALEVNGVGAGNVAAAADSAGAVMVHVSTDYVFDGTKSAPYAESDAPNPRSGYGRSKLEGELAVAAANPRHAIVRSSWLFGVGGPNFVATMLERGAERGEVSVVTDQVGCPTFTGHLAGALVALAERGATGLLHVAGAGHCSWHDFAVEIFREAGVDCQVHPTDTAATGRPAPRPGYSVLVSERPDAPRLPSWRDGLAEYLAAREVAA